MLYELVTGCLPFPGEAEAAVAYAILHNEPEPLTALRTGLPTELDRVVAKALAKRPEERYQHVDELQVDLVRLLNERDPGRAAIRVEPGALPASPRRRTGFQFRYVAVALFSLLAGITPTVFWLGPTTDGQLPLRRFVIRPPGPIPSVPDYNAFAAISPNGRYIAVIAGEGRGKLWIHHLDQGSSQPVEGSEGARGPFWSPGSDYIGFAAESVLKKVDVKGGSATRVSALGRTGSFYGGSWSPDGRSIVFASGDPSLLFTVPAEGGNAELLLTPRKISQPAGEGSSGPDWQAGYLFNPNFLSGYGGSRLAFAFGYADTTLMIQDFDRGKAETVGRGAAPFYSPTGHILYQSGTSEFEIWATPLSLKNVRSAAESFLVVKGGVDASVASDGTLVYIDAYPEQLVWLDRKGLRVGKVGHPVLKAFYPALSPDEKFVGVETREGANLDVWIADLARGARTRLTADPATDILPVWSPDGEYVAFSSYRAGNIDVYLRRADGIAEEKVLVATADNERVSDWSQDGKHIVYSHLDIKNGYDLWRLDRNEKGDWKPHSFLQTPFNERSPKLSPDGRYVAYISDESGRDEVYVKSFPLGDRKWTVSANGASQLRWCRSGRELFYSEAGTLVAVPVQTKPDFAAGPPTRLFYHASLATSPDANYDVSADGQRILLPEIVEAQRRERMIHVVQNWFAEFKDR